MHQPSDLVELSVIKLVAGGQGLAELPDGKKVFVWNALPGEAVGARIIKRKHSYAEAIAEQIIKPSLERVVPREPAYLATSPWQIMTFAAENKYKHQLVEDIFAQAKVNIPSFELVATSGGPFGYRNKSEFGFWGDETGLHLASYHRASHGKQVVDGRALNMPGIDAAANNLLAQLNKLHVRAGDLKTIIVRSSQPGQVAISLFVKPTSFPKLSLPDGMQGLRVYHSNPKSPASVPTKLLHEIGDCMLQDNLLGNTFTYDVDSFFQVNVAMFEQALRRIKEHLDVPAVIDMYTGVGSIGLSIAGREVQLIELHPATAKMAKINAAASGLDATVIETSAENALEYIVADKPVIFDPPRAGLHDKIIARIRDVLPPMLTYLSCNPVTQARDLALLQDLYTIDYFEAFNFFPRTPHIETLAILRPHS